MSKHRLGKRERMAKRNLIRDNLANLSSMERSSGTMHSTLTGVHKGQQYCRIAANVHTMGAYVGASEGRLGPRQRSTSKRWGLS